MKLILLGFFLFVSSLAFGKTLERVIAVVNSKPILSSDVTRLQKDLKERPEFIDALFIPKTKESLAKSRKEQIDFLIAQKIVESEVKRNNLEISAERVDKEIRGIARSNNITKDQLFASLKSQGISPSQYQDFMRSRIEKQQLIQKEVSSKIRISDQEVTLRFLKNNPSMPSSHFKYSLAHILFVKKSGSDDPKKRAESVFKKLQSGESFEILAKKYSEDPGFQEGGFFGTFRSGEFLKPLELAISNLNEGQTSKVVQSRAGYHIVKVLKKDIVGNPLFEKRKEVIRNQLFQEAFKEQLDNWLQNKKSEVHIRING